MDCPLCLVDKHFTEPIPGQEGGRRKQPSHAWFICNVSKEALSDAGFGDSYKPKKQTSYWCPICKHALCIDPCLRLYHTEKDYTSKITKIPRMSVKPIQKDAQHVLKKLETTQLYFPTFCCILIQVGYLCSNSLTAWAVMCIVHILKYLRVAFKFIMSSHCQ